ncbi:sporulation protein YpjB [Virgibacillus xinjiangensis]|uniref:Sporulation protein YpjB n=1 Tax=Virgibacillus xinjiangensis TaxID=393090 RepID=A0ABV7CR73_9BACI
MAKKCLLCTLTTVMFIIVMVADPYLHVISASVKMPVIYTAGHPDLSILFWAVGIIGGCIALTLSYVSWRKYKGEKERNKQENKDKSID